MNMENRHKEVTKKPVVAYSVRKDTIYRSLSPVCIMGCPEFRIDWSCLERKEPIGSYEQILESYRGGDFCQKDMAECFTKAEVEMLDAYLWKAHSWGMKRSKYKEPIFPTVLVMNSLGEFSFRSPNKELRYVELSAQEGYNLPFKVVGYGYRI
jgi:hypothetical protein